MSARHWMYRIGQPVLVLLLLLIGAVSVSAQNAPALVGWDALSPTAEVSQPDPNAVLHRPDAFDPLVDGLVVIEEWADGEFAVNPRVVDRDVLMDGYVLPLAWEEEKVTEFLLVPWVGACIHTPAPPPNQIVHVLYAGGLALDRPYQAVRLGGVLQEEQAAHDLFLIDGRREISAAYTLRTAAVAGTPGEIVAASAAEVPLIARVQIWANSLFTDSMEAIGEGGSTNALLFALLLSFGYGALHTLGPGHGKAVVISYFVGTGGSLRRGLAMGTRIAVFHVLSAVVVVFLLDLAVRQTTGTAPSDYRAIRLGSYALIMAIGSVMLWQAISAARASRESEHASHSHSPSHDHDHAHHHHEHHHHHSHSGCSACAAAAAPKGSGWVAASVGVVPCTGALLVMLFGLANDMILPAILMVIAISAGMALAMSAIGIAALWGRSVAENRMGADPARRQRFETGARLAGASCVLAIGTVLFALTLSIKPLPPMPVKDLAMGKGEAAAPSDQRGL